MAKLRSVNVQFWDDEWVQELAPTEKLLFLYLLTNPLVTIAGAYKIPIRTMAFETGLSATAITKCLERFEADGRIIYKDGWVVLRNFLKNQNLNANMVKGVISLLTDAPAWVTDSVWKAIKAFETLRKAFEPFERDNSPEETLRKEEVEGERESEGEAESADAAPPASRKVEMEQSPFDHPAVVLYQEKFGVNVSRSFATEIEENVKDLNLWKRLITEKIGFASGSVAERQKITRWFLAAYLERLEKQPKAKDDLPTLEEKRRLDNEHRVLRRAPV